MWVIIEFLNPDMEAGVRALGYLYINSPVDTGTAKLWKKLRTVVYGEFYYFLSLANYKLQTNAISVHVYTVSSTSTMYKTRFVKNI